MHRTTSSLRLAAALVACAALGPASVLAQDAPLPNAALPSAPPPSATPPDPIRFSPFLWQEVLRVDQRPTSPVTESSVIVAPALPLVATRNLAVTVLPGYRLDELRNDVVGGGETLHRFELGFLADYRFDERWALNVDLRAVNASTLQNPAADDWYPNIRAGVTWQPTDHFAVSGAVVWTRGVLGLIPVPVLGLFWRPDDLPIRIDGLLPRYLEVAFPLTGTFELFTAGHWENLAWSLETGPSQRDFLVRQEVRIQAGVRTRLYGPIGVEISSQWVPWSRLDLGSEGQTFTPGDDFSLTVALVIDKVGARRASLGE